MLRPLACLLTATLLSACASTSQTTSVGQDMYRLSYNAGAKWQTWVEVKNIAREQAVAHCQSLGKRMTDPKVTSNHATGLAPKVATIEFLCSPLPAQNSNAKNDKS
ncbi:hypothetical protein [Bordetella sp. 15P40C-2]|uniref:hypothetical protein n=1 Tax=Bordetella sp. 15P40C-2 TaxID=2572246 RepID=UPI00132C9432|nr:hypothetical protein [Bordetella sp. 15P40C-2]MVW72201.1 hypothetical protein [Bordetella sp. 15P40C-2]